MQIEKNMAGLIEENFPKLDLQNQVELAEIAKHLVTKFLKWNQLYTKRHRLYSSSNLFIYLHLVVTDVKSEIETGLVSTNDVIIDGQITPPITTPTGLTTPITTPTGLEFVRQVTVRG